MSDTAHTTPSIQWRTLSIDCADADQPEDRDPNVIRVMLDPAGHPFCLFVLS